MTKSIQEFQVPNPIWGHQDKQSQLFIILPFDIQILNNLGFKKYI